MILLMILELASTFLRSTWRTKILRHIMGNLAVCLLNSTWKWKVGRVAHTQEGSHLFDTCSGNLLVDMVIVGTAYFGQRAGHINANPLLPQSV